MEFLVYRAILDKKGWKSLDKGFGSGKEEKKKWKRRDHGMETRKSTDFCLSVFIYLNTK